MSAVVAASRRLGRAVVAIVEGWSARERLAAAVIVAGGMTVVVVAAALSFASGGTAPSGAVPPLPPSIAATHPPSPSGTSPGADETVPPSETWPATREDPVYVWVAGDSLGTQLADALVPLLRRTRVFNPTGDTRTSSGLCRPDFYDWPAEVRTAMHTAAPDAVVIMLGANDTQDVWDEGRWIPYGTPAWTRTYRERVRGVLQAMLEHDVHRVYWVGLPIMAQEWRNQRVAVLNGIYRSEAARHKKRVRYVDAWSLFAAGGGYTPAGRMGDGVHFTVSGEQRLAAEVLRRLRADW
jgi:hypothetical protein